MDAKEYLIDKVVFPNEKPVLLNSGELIALMEGYAASKPYSPEVARRLLKMRDHLEGCEYEDDWYINEAYSELMSIADPTDKVPALEHWNEMVRIAKEK